MRARVLLFYIGTYIYINYVTRINVMRGKRRRRVFNKNVDVPRRRIYARSRLRKKLSCEYRSIRKIESYTRRIPLRLLYIYIYTHISTYIVSIYYCIVGYTIRISRDKSFYLWFFIYIYIYYIGTFINAANNFYKPTPVVRRFNG